MVNYEILPAAVAGCGKVLWYHPIPKSDVAPKYLLVISVESRRWDMAARHAPFCIDNSSRIISLHPNLYFLLAIDAFYNHYIS